MLFQGVDGALGFFTETRPASRNLGCLSSPSATPAAIITPPIKSSILGFIANKTHPCALLNNSRRGDKTAQDQRRDKVEVKKVFVDWLHPLLAPPLPPPPGPKSQFFSVESMDLTQC